VLELPRELLLREGVMRVGGIDLRRRFRPAGLRALIVDGVHADTVEPCGEAGAAAKRGQSEPGADNRFLHGVARIVRGAEEARGKREQPVLVAVDELLERPAVAFLGAAYEWSVRIIHA
jgi:hypothetical protein